MRCIEIYLYIDNSDLTVEINRNMRCIEIEPDSGGC